MCIRDRLWYPCAAGFPFLSISFLPRYSRHFWLVHVDFKSIIPSCLHHHDSHDLKSFLVLPQQHQLMVQLILLPMTKLPTASKTSLANRSPSSYAASSSLASSYLDTVPSRCDAGVPSLFDLDSVRGLTFCLLGGSVLHEGRSCLLYTSRCV